VLLQTPLSKVSLRALATRLAVLSRTTTTEVERAINEALDARKPTTDSRRNLLATFLYVLSEDFAGLDRIPNAELGKHGVIKTADVQSRTSLEDAMMTVKKAIAAGDPALSGTFLAAAIDKVEKTGKKHVKRSKSDQKSTDDDEDWDEDDIIVDEMPLLIDDSSSESSEEVEGMAANNSRAHRQRKRKQEMHSMASAVAAAVAGALQAMPLQVGAGKTQATALTSFAEAAEDGCSWKAKESTSLDKGSGAGLRAMNRSIMAQNGAIGSDGFADPDSVHTIKRFLPTQYHTEVVEKGKIGIDFGTVATRASLESKVSVSGAEFEIKSNTPRVKMNLRTWELVFEMYMTSFVSAVPTFGTYLTNYRAMIQDFAHDFGLEPALRYDSLFRKQAEAHYLSSHVLLNFKKSNRLFSTVFHGIAAARCTLCKSQDHDTADHVEDEQPRQSTKQGGGRAPCPAWNKGEACDKKTCTLAHKCSGCGGGQFPFHDCYRCNPSAAPGNSDQPNKKAKFGKKGGKP
jgi:hypothetical protein